MKDLTLDENQKLWISSLIKFQSVEIIWDINAFYFNTEISTFKLECLDDKPTGSKNMYDEIFYCTFEMLPQRIMFNGDDPKLWYKIVCSDCKIIEIKYINIIQVFPENNLVPIDNSIKENNGHNKSTIGLIIHTGKGYLPAFLLPGNHGFTWQPKFDFYTKTEIDILIEENLKYYEIQNCT